MKEGQIVEHHHPTPKNCPKSNTGPRLVGGELVVTKQQTKKDAK